MKNFNVVLSLENMMFVRESFTEDGYDEYISFESLSIEPLVSGDESVREFARGVRAFSEGRACLDSHCEVMNMVKHHYCTNSVRAGYSNMFCEDYGCGYEILPIYIVNGQEYVKRKDFDWDEFCDKAGYGRGWKKGYKCYTFRGSLFHKVSEMYPLEK